MAAVRWTQSDNRKSLLTAVTVITTVGIVLSLTPYFIPQVRSLPLLARITWFSTYTFPLYPPAACILSGLGIGAIFVATAQSTRRLSFLGLALANLGRVSLTVFLLHIFLFREVLGWFGGSGTLSDVQTGLVLGVTLLMLAGLAWWWRRVDYRYSAEWFMRKGPLKTKLFPGG